jgi:hypothetical protein
MRGAEDQKQAEKPATTPILIIDLPALIILKNFMPDMPACR